MRELAVAGGIWLLPGGVVPLWLAGFALLLLLAVTSWRYATGGALRIFSIAVAAHAFLCLIATQMAADVSARQQNPSDVVSAAGLALLASSLVGVGGCWLGRAWTPRPRISPEPPAAIDWGGEGRHAIVTLLWMLLLIFILVITFPAWGLALFLWALLSPTEPWSWSAGSLELGFSLAVVVALAAYVWLSTGDRGAQRAPVRPTAALPLGVLCGLIAISLPILPSFARPPLRLLHDRALFAKLRDSAATDAVDSFDSARRELVRRPSDRAHSAEAVSRELRRISGGSGSMSAQLAARERPPAPSGGSPCNNFLDLRSPSLTERGPPELAVIDVLLARGATQEVWAWLTDAAVPLNLRSAMVEGRSLTQTFRRANLIAAFGKNCVEVQKRGALSGQASAESASCRSAIERLFPGKQSAFTIEEGFAVAYAMVAIGQSPGAQVLLSQASGDVAFAMLRGMRAAELGDASRRPASTQFLDCSTLASLAIRVCPADRVPDCATDGARHSFADLEPCLSRLPPEMSPDLRRLGGY